MRAEKINIKNVNSFVKIELKSCIKMTVTFTPLNSPDKSIVVFKHLSRKRKIH